MLPIAGTRSALGLCTHTHAMGNTQAGVLESRRKWGRSWGFLEDMRLASRWQGKHPEGLTGSLGGPEEHGLRSQIQRDAKCCSANRKYAAQAPLDLLATLLHPKGVGPKSAAGTACLSVWHLHLPAAQMVQVKKHCPHSRSEGRKENRTATAHDTTAAEHLWPLPSSCCSGQSQCGSGVGEMAAWARQVVFPLSLFLAWTLLCRNRKATGNRWSHGTQHVCTCGQHGDKDLESWPGQMGSQHPLPHRPSLRQPLLGCFRAHKQGNKLHGTISRALFSTGNNCLNFPQPQDHKYHDTTFVILIRRAPSVGTSIQRNKRRKPRAAAQQRREPSGCR